MELIAKGFKLLEVLLISIVFFVESFFTGGISFTKIGYKILNALNTVNVLHYDITLETFPAQAKIQFQSKLTVRTTEDNVQEVYFLLKSDYRVEEVKCNQVKAKFHLLKIPTQKVAIVWINLPQTFRLGEELELELTYRGKPKGPLSYINKEGAELDIYGLWYPLTGLEDFFTARQRLIVPKGQRALGNGKLVEVIKGKQNDTYIFESKTPLVVMNFASSDFKYDSKRVGNKKFEFFYSSPYSKFTSQIKAELPGILKFYQEKFGDYDYELLRVVETPNPNQSAYSSLFNVIIHSSFLDSLNKEEDSVYQEKRLYHLLAHEVSHQWWGNQAAPKILNGGWWLVEGLAEYSSLLALENKYGEEELKRTVIKSELKGYQDYLKRHEDKALNLASFFEGYSGSLFYYKGSLIFHMLRYLVGEEDFEQILRLYFERFRFNFADIGDFQKICEEVGQKDLDWFFNQWLRSSKRLDFEVSDIKLKRGGKHNVTTEVIIKNLGEIVWQAPVEVLIETEKGKEIRKWELKKKINKIEIETTSLVKSITVDPNFWLLDFNRDNNYLSVRREI